MLKPIIAAIFGNRHQRELKRVQPIVAEINEEYERLQSVSEEELRSQTEKLRAIIGERTAELETQIAERKERKRTTADAAEREEIDAELLGVDGRGGLEGQLRAEIAEVLDEILPEAFATVRETCRRLLGTTVDVTGQPLEWNMVPYDVQLIGGIQLHRGRIAEMATGEGKTLVATLPLYLNALAGKGAHLVTVNSYLARRDSQWMGHVYTYLGLTVGCLDDSEPGTEARRDMYLRDITYGTNNEFGFDYLRDNMVTTLEQRVQRGHWYAIVDEVDSVLVDEARTPLIISGPVGSQSDTMYREHNTAVARLVRAQGEYVNRIVAEAEKLLEEGNTEDAAVPLYQAKLGAPKNRRFLKIMQEQGTKQLVQKTELEHIGDRKLPMSRQRFRDIEDRLLYVLDEKGHSVHLTDRGVEFLSPSDPDEFVLPDISERIHRVDHDPDLEPQQKLDARAEVEREYAAKAEKLNIIHQLLRAYSLYEKDVNYVVQDGQVLIVDEFTGRTMPGRRWAEGLHQAVEAKEGVQVKGETQTLATITIQNYFRMYDKLAGMTGTAETEETEFHQIYGLDVAVIPTNKPVIREDRQDLIYKTRREKYNAIADEAERLHKLGLPVLVGTASVETSETIARMFKLRGMKPEVLNAKYHQREAEIVALAGQPGAITIATNMAGRGTDIKLGPGVTDSRPSAIMTEEGKEEAVDECGGLHIVGSERHESRRIDRQLRGRAGRQGDPGASQFFLSLEDDLMRLFGSERIAKLMDRLGAQEGEVLTHSMITRSIENAQKRVEMQNFQIRKRLLDYDDVMNQQREVIYSLRSFALEGGEELKGEALKMVEKAVERRVETNLAKYDDAEDWDIPLLKQDLLMHFLLTVPVLEDDVAPTDAAEVTEGAVNAGREAFGRKLTNLGEFSDRLLALVMLNVIDEKWKEHLYDLDQLRSAINYRAWGQKDPLMEYKQEAYSMFVDLMSDIHNTFAERFLRVQLVFEQRPPVTQTAPAGAGAAKYDAFGVSAAAAEKGTAAASGMGPATTATGPAATSSAGAAQKREPAVFSGGRTQSLSGMAQGAIGGGAGKPAADWTNVGRNDPCPCGSGKKFKKCHGAAA